MNRTACTPGQAGDLANKGAMKVFHGSISYLTVLFLALALDPFIGCPVLAANRRAPRQASRPRAPITSGRTVQSIRGQDGLSDRLSGSEWAYGGGRAYLTGLLRARSAAFVAALISRAAPSMCAPTRSAGMPL